MKKTTDELEDKILEFSKTHNVVSVAFYNESDEHYLTNAMVIWNYTRC